MIRSISITLALGLPALFGLMAEDCEGGEPAPDADYVLVGLDDVHQYFGGGDTRTVTEDIQFPDDTVLYSKILMRYTLSCPDGGCDPWDRLGWVSILRGDETLEIARIITPYGVGGTFEVDVTDLRPLLTGERQIQSFIDTWVNPGWLVNISFEFWEGEPERHAIAVEPIFNQWIVYGDPARPVGAQMAAQSIQLRDEAASARVMVLTTGHGQGNSENCAEFCPKAHSLIANDTAHTEVLWRDDCPETAVKPQGGNWTSPRAGWCPGASVYPRWVELGAVEGASLEIGYDVEPYENTCRADHEGGCEACMSFVSSCDYNGGDHTEPKYRVSALLVTYSD